jgi:hypothetical protein
MSHGPPAWWLELQGKWSRALARPLEFQHGTFVSPDAKQAASVLELDGNEGSRTSRFELYHVQVWQRVCATVQEGLPCTTRVIEPLLLNRIALMVFAESPPDDRSLDSVSDRVGAVIRKSVAAPRADTPPTAGQVRQLLESASVRLPVLQQAVQLDLAHRIAFQAAVPRVAQAVPQLSDVHHGTQVAVNPTLSVLKLTHDMYVEGAPDLASALHVVVVRSVDGIRTDTVDPILARLLTLARSQTLGQARESIANSVAPSSQESLDSRLDTAIRVAFERNYWLGTR